MMDKIWCFAWRQIYCNMADVRLGSGESFESLLRRFNRQVQHDNTLAEVRRRRFYEKPSEERKKKEAIKRQKSSKWPR
jgi:small subunit ribosomal protein S21